ncbi:MAG TPA: T9SS type A sorting domain-containing protein [Chitinophagales bacterium]
MSSSIDTINIQYYGNGILEYSYTQPNNTDWASVGSGAENQMIIASTSAGCQDTAQLVWASCNTTTQTICQDSSYVWHSNTYNTAGTYTYGFDTLILTLSICSLDSSDVWPGDANHDGIADNYDLLYIGIGYNNNGPIRQDQSIVWSAHACNDWGLQFTNGTNLKHADCNGNGVINADDTLAVVQNFDLTHNKNNEREDDRSGAPYLNVAFNNDTFVNGDTLIASIQLGSSDVLANNVYGVAFTYNFDASVLDTSSIKFFYTNSWLDSDTAQLSIAKNFYDLGQIKTAISRTDHTTRSGNGEIAQFRAIITTDNINGISWHNTSHFISLSKAVDNVGYLIALNEGIDSAVVLKSSLGISDVKEISFTLSPNPANSTITIKGTENIEGIVIANVLGEKVFTENNASTGSAKVLDISMLPNGIYIAQINTHKGIGEKRFVVAK